MSSIERDVRRLDRLMDPAEARAYLQATEVAYIGTVSADGWPYVLPMCFIYEGQDVLWFHHGKKPGHLLDNLSQSPRVCLTVAERGHLIPGATYACQSSQEYVSVLAYGQVERIEEETVKNWFFDQLLLKYDSPGHRFPDPSYPLNHKIILWKMHIDRLSGKRSEQGGH